MIRTASKTKKDVGVRGRMLQTQEEISPIFHDFVFLPLQQKNQHEIQGVS
jgi:hypothetical protein